MTSDAAQKMRKENGINYFVPHVRRSLHHIISLSLLALRAWEDYEEMDKHLPARLQQVDQYKAKFEQRQKEWRPYVEHTKEGRENKKGSNEEFWEHEERMGAIFPRPYPQAGPTIDRTSEAFLQKLNGIICHETNWPLRIDRDQGSGLRVCANRDINEGEMLFAEEPSARSHLRRPTDGRPMEEEVSSETFCENCKRPISARDRAALEGLWEGLVNDDQRGSHSVVCACLVADPHLSFCRETLGIVGTNGSHEADELEEVDEPALSSRRRGKRPADQMSGAGPEQNTKRAKGNAGKRIATATSGSGPAGAPEDGSGDAPGTSCLQKARQLYHYRVCGKDWRWLHNAMGRISEDRVKGTPAVSHERHGTFLSLLLREVFDMTLKKRNVDPGKHYLAHEINPMIPLQSESPDGPFPFGWSANIVVPFGILQELGVNIFKDLEFDTWVIQTVLRKLLINAVPWDSVRRGNRDPVNISISKGKKSTGGKSSAGQQESSEKANIENLYIHTGFALFNHACSDHANARWSWDDEPPPNPTFGADLCVRNRIVVKSTMAITEKSEILLKYYPEDPEGMRKAEFERLVLKQKRVLGQRCNCEGCDRRMGDNYEEEL